MKKKILKIVKRILLTLLFLMLFLLLILQLPFIQNTIKNRVLVLVNQQLETPLSVEKIKISFFDYIKVKKALWGSPGQDTLVYIKELSVDVHFMDLLKNKIHVEEVHLDGVKGNVLKGLDDGVLNITKAIKVNSDTLNTDTTKSAGSINVALDRLLLSNIKMVYHDEVDSSKISAKLKMLDIKIDRIDIQKNIFNIRSIKLDGLGLIQDNYKTYESINDNTFESDTTTSKLDFQISIKDAIEVSNLNLNLKDQLSKQNFKLENTSFVVKPEWIHLSEHNIKLKQFNIVRTDVSLHTAQSSELESGESKPFSFEDLGWNIELLQFKLNRGSFYSGSFDSSNNLIGAPLQLDSLQLHMKDFILDSKHLEVNIPIVQMRYNKKVHMQHLSASLWIDERKAQIKQLKFETEKSLARIDAEVNYDSFQQLNDNLEKTQLNIQLDTRLNSYDIAQIIQQSLKLKHEVDFNLKTEITGSLSKLNLRKLKGSVEGAFLLDVKGELRHLNDIKRLSSNMQLDKLQLNTSKLMAYLPDSLIPGSVHYPDNILLKGVFNGSKEKLSSDIQLQSSVGNLDACLSINLDSIPNTEFYDAKLNVDQLNLGYILQKEDTLQSLSMTGSISGSTKDFRNPDLTMKLNLLQLGLLKYTYKEGLINGNYSDKYFKGNVEINDENLAFKFNGELDLEDSIPFINANLHLRKANLKTLHLMSDSSSVKGNFSVSVEGGEWNKLKGNVALNQFQYQTLDQKYAMDSLSVDLKQMSDSSVYNLAIRRIYSQDTLLLRSFDVGAFLRGNKALINYELAGENKDKAKSKKVLVQGEGRFQLQNDTMMLNTDLLWYQNLLKDPLKLNLDVSQIKTEEYNAYGINALGDQINLNGYAKLFNANVSDNIEASVHIDSLDFSLIEPLTRQYLNTFKGYLSGTVNIVGNKTHPDIGGYLILKKTRLNPSAVNTDFNIEEGKILLDNSLISFNHLKITDKDNDEAYLDGTVNFADMSDPVFDLKLNANQFLLLNKSESSQGNYFGKVVADLNARISGNTESPDIALTTAFNHKSDLTYVVTSSEPKAASQDDVVIFIKDSTAIAQQDSIDQDLMAVNMKGMNIATNISVSDRMDITLVIDPASNERLNIVGNGDLSLAIDPSGNQTLTGQYRIKKGSYTLRLYDVIKRDFEIKEGSSLTWYGDVMNADAKISAIYKVRTNALSLMGVTQSQLSDTEYSTYNTSINVEVVMNLSGNLLSPDIDFDINLTDKNVNTNIESAISQLSSDESELNKQVFSLLILNRFSSNRASASTTVSYEIENTARQSLSKLLSQQLNRFSNQYLKGVDVSFDIDSYNQVVENQVNTRTDVSIDVSQNLFNERLKLTVGGNVAVEENRQQGNASSSDLTGDFEVEYKISKDGTYRVKAFNKTEYEDELNGDVTKTGLSFMFIKDFTRFSDLFKNRKKKNEDNDKNK